jgi:hypothetical protein
MIFRYDDDNGVYVRSSTGVYCLYGEVAEMKKEFIERYKDLLDEAMNHYPYTPNAFRKTVEEYYQEEIKYLEGLK